MANYLTETGDTSVKFYSKLTRAQAKGTVPIGTDAQGNDVYVEPGAICFVADESGNSIFLNKRLFGDGATAGSVTPGGGGTGGGGGLTEVNLSDIVVVEKDGQTLKTLADYFNADGTFITDSLKITGPGKDDMGNDITVTYIEMSSEGLFINGKEVATKEYVNLEVQAAEESAINTSKNYTDSQIASGIQDAKDYADTLVSKVYTPKGSVSTYSELLKISNPKTGWVYNVVNSYSDPGKDDYIPAGTNYVYIEITDTQASNYPGYWDALGGTIDLSNYVNKTHLENYYKTASDTTSEIGQSLQDSKDYTDGKIADLKINVDANSASIISANQALQTQLGMINNNITNINQNTTNITNIATQLTWQ